LKKAGSRRGSNAPNKWAGSTHPPGQAIGESHLQFQVAQRLGFDDIVVYGSCSKGESGGGVVDAANFTRSRVLRPSHQKPDLVLIYRKPDGETLQLVRLGSHSELGL
jgi:hypothetical protein